MLVDRCFIQINKCANRVDDIRNGVNVTNKRDSLEIKQEA